MAATSSGKAMVTLPSEKEILITREFDAPRELVFRAWTAPELVRRWWSGRRGNMQVVEIDLRVGGAWRYVTVATGGYEVGFHGEFREIVPGERIVTTEIYEGAPEQGEPPLNVVTFSDTAAGGTLLELLVKTPDKAVRDIIIESGMETGMQSRWTRSTRSHARCAERVSSLRASRDRGRLGAVAAGHRSRARGRGTRRRGRGR
jgi:uncharacterized protein YndB with AHSA1/START domain